MSSFITSQLAVLDVAPSARDASDVLAVPQINWQTTEELWTWVRGLELPRQLDLFSDTAVLSRWTCSPGIAVDLGRAV
jgi:hypothetical protein